MAFVYPDVNQLIGRKKVGNDDCIALVREFTNLPSHWQWREGEKVLDNPGIRPGTAIATFVKGRYPNNKTGQHAAFFLRHDSPGNGFWVLAQRKDKPGMLRRNIQRHQMKVFPYKQLPNGTWWWASNNAQAFSNIELNK